jgi:choline kinase
VSDRQRPEGPEQRLPPALILAAGRGVRLGALTATRPKAMLELGGISLLERTLDALEGAGFARALIVAGHASDVITDFLRRRGGTIVIDVIHNPRYAVTNNIVSLLVASDALREGFCLLNSDILFAPEILGDVGDAGEGAWLVVDRDEPLGDEEMKVQTDVGGTVWRISKLLPPADCVGEYIGIARFDARSAATLIEAASMLVAGGGEHLYYEDAIDSAAPRLAARMIFTERRPWTEIDDLVDLDRAGRIAARMDRMAAR